MYIKLGYLCEKRYIVCQTGYLWEILPMKTQYDCNST
jgi:hypothetical protein